MPDLATLVVCAAGLAAAFLLLRRLDGRLRLSLAKHPTLAGHPRMARTLSRLVPFHEYADARFFAADDAPDAVQARRRAGFDRLARNAGGRHARSVTLTQEAARHVSDLQFTRNYRVPYPFSRHVRAHLPSGAFMTATRGVKLVDADGHEYFDLAGSYGVNVFGHAFYKACIERGAAHVQALGPVLGHYHPLVAANARAIARLSGQDEVSFHMSGTEAVMQAVRLARYHTGRAKVVCFSGAYHGWWGDVQPGVGNPLRARDTLVLAEMSARTLGVLRRRRDIACVLVNPLQALHPNHSAPSDASLLGRRAAHFDRAAYGAWLRDLREVCTQRNIVLVFDEVFLGFRLAKGGAQEYFDVRADLVTYGKTLGGGLPIGIVCGRRALMRRFRDDRPADVCLARGTFNAHPYVMGAMHEFFAHLDTPEADALYAAADATWRARARRLNEALREHALPFHVAHIGSVFTVCHASASRYNWMLQYYLRAQGIALSWVGTGRLIFSFDYTDEDFAEVVRRFVGAGVAMREDGWWWTDEATSAGARAWRLLRDVVGYRLRVRAASLRPEVSATHADARPSDR